MSLSLRSRLVLGTLVAMAPVAVALVDSYRRELSRQEERVRGRVEAASQLVAAEGSGFLAAVREEFGSVESASGRTGPRRLRLRDPACQDGG